MTAIDPATATSAGHDDRDPLAPSSPRPWLGWLRASRRRQGLGRIPIWLRALVSIAVTLALGTWGFRELRVGHSGQPVLSWPESIYRAVRLYTLDLGPAGGGAGEPHPNWQLWLALLLAALLVLRALLGLARERVRGFAARRFLRGHVIVCGGGVHGTEFVAAFGGGRAEHRAEHGDAPDEHDVVLIDPDPSSPGMHVPFARFEWRLVADATRPETLVAAGIERAHMIVVNTGNDFVNSQIVSAVRDLAKHRRVRDRIHVLVQVEDPALARFLEEETELGHAMIQSEGPVPVVSPFSANAIAADTLIRDSKVKHGEEHDKFLSMRQVDGKAVAPNLLLAGDHPLLDAVLLTVLRRWRVRHLRGLEENAQRVRPPLHVSVFGPGATGRVQRLRRRFLPESQVLTIEAFDSDPPAQDGSNAGDRRRKGYDWLHQAGRADHAIVACLEELDGVALTLELSRQLGDSVLMTRVTTQPQSVLDEHLRDRTKRSSRFATTEVKSVAELACKREKMTRLSGPQRLADALGTRAGTGLELDRVQEYVTGLFDRSELELHSDSAWRVLPSELPLLEQLVAPVRVSALVSAGLTVNLAPPPNLLAVARDLAGSEHSLTAWCEYARHVDAGYLEEIQAQIGELTRRPEHDREASEAPDAREAPEPPKPAPDPVAAELLRLRARTLGAPRADPTLPAQQRLAPGSIAIFAGGRESMSSLARAELRALLSRALIGYDGTILIDGTTAGLSVLVEDVAEQLGCRAVLYADTRPRSKGHARVRLLDGFSAEPCRAPLAMWRDIVASGVPVDNVRVVTLPRRDPVMTETIMARALGAQVAWLDLAGDANEPLYDLLPLGTDHVHEPPIDAMTIRAFLSSSLLEPDVRETVARYLHGAYRRKHRKRKDADDPALVPWDELIEPLRRSNWAQADDIPNKLALVGKQLSDSGGELELTDEQVELLAEVEHGRFNIERMLAGWQLGDRHVAQNVTPYLKPWDELDEQAKDYDREAVRNIAPALREAGCGVTDKNARPANGRGVWARWPWPDVLRRPGA